jgi:hypothetical protein
MIPAYYIIVAMIIGLGLLVIGNFGKVAWAAARKQEKSA